MKILVCGSRTYSDNKALNTILDTIHSRCGIRSLVHGAARGADSLGGQWAKNRGVQELSYPADWDSHGKSAGPVRNADMLRCNPDIELLVAFPGTKGTADMIAKAKHAQVPVIQVPIILSKVWLDSLPNMLALTQKTPRNTNVGQILFPRER